jgi:hypothetical protein
MKNKWTTLEEQTERANESISEILDGVTTEHSKRNKSVAIVMAAVGVFLIGLGLFPFMDNFSSDRFNADISDINIFETPETVDTVEDVDPVDFENDDFDVLTQDPDIEFLPVEPGSVVTFEDDEDITRDNADIDAGNTDTGLPSVNTQKNSIFPMNTHTGTSDKNIMVFGEGGIKSTNTAINTQDTQYHAAAEQTSDTVPQSGPESWVAVMIALFTAFVLRRKKMRA